MWAEVSVPNIPITGHLAAPLLAPRAEVLEVGVRPVRLLPGQHAQQAEEEHDAELEDVLDPVHLETAVTTVIQKYSYLLEPSKIFCEISQCPLPIESPYEGFLLFDTYLLTYLRFHNHESINTLPSFNDYSTW